MRRRSAKPGRLAVGVAVGRLAEPVAAAGRLAAAGGAGRPRSSPQRRRGPSGWQQTADGRWVQAGAATSSGKSTAALVLGILGLVFCPLICSVLALVFGYQSRNEIDASGGQLSGRGSAVAGIVLGWIGVVIWALFLILIIIGLAVGRQLDRRRHARAASRPELADDRAALDERVGPGDARHEHGRDGDARPPARGSGSARRPAASAPATIASAASTTHGAL